MSTRVDEETQFFIQAYDERGLACDTGGAVFDFSTAAFSGQSTDPWNNGTYLCTYSTTLAGSQRMTVSLDGVVTQEGPYDISVRPGPVAPARSTLEGPALNGGVVGQEAVFFVVLRDSFDNPLESGNDAVVAVQSSPALDFTITPADGQSRVSFVPLEAVNHELRVTVNSITPDSSPISIAVAEAENVESSWNW